MNYCLAQYEQTQDAETYRVYITEAARMAENHLAGISASLGNPATQISKKYFEIAHGEVEPEETRTEEEIIDHFRTAFGNMGN